MTRQADTNPRVRLVGGFITGVILAAAEGLTSGFVLLDSLLFVALTALVYWLLTPLARLSLRHPLQAGLLAALAGAGVGALWWAALAPDYWVWLPISVGAGLALMSLAPFDSTAAPSPKVPPKGGSSCNAVLRTRQDDRTGEPTVRPNSDDERGKVTVTSTGAA